MNDQWNIVICDDDTVFIELLKNHIEREADKIGVVCEIVSYSDGNLLLKQKAMKGDLYFIDIEMPELSGMDLAAWIKAQTREAEIIFVSNHAEAVFESIRYEPFRFIRKAHLKDELPEAFCELVKKRKKYQDTIVLYTQKQLVCVAKSKIVYVESQAHYLFFHVMNEDGKESLIRCRGKISDYESFLMTPDFLSPGKSFLLNCAYIEAFSLKEIVMKSDRHISVSRDRKEQIKQLYMQYMRSRIRGMD